VLPGVGRTAGAELMVVVEGALRAARERLLGVIGQRLQEVRRDDAASDGIGHT
jgi:hypothetical protein